MSYLAEGRRALGVIPSQETLVLERFFDESGGMQLVLHAPFGSRINKAWGLALRKRFCRQFNFELQAAATEDALMLSLGPQHSFPLSDVFRYLHPETTRDVLVQALSRRAGVQDAVAMERDHLAGRAARQRAGARCAPQIQRMLADDLMAAVFPDAAACLENIPGDRQIPDHPLVSQTVRDCLEEAMDFEGLRAVLGRIHRGRAAARRARHAGAVALRARDPQRQALRLSRRCAARGAAEPRGAIRGGPPIPASAGDLGALDADAIARVREEERPDPRDADELHDALLTAGFLIDVRELEARRAGAARGADRGAARGQRSVRRIDAGPARHRRRRRAAAGTARDPSGSRRLAGACSRRRRGSARSWTRSEAIAEILRGRVTLTRSGHRCGAGGRRSAFRPRMRTRRSCCSKRTAWCCAAGSRRARRQLEWCDRTLLARIHRYTLNRLRAEIEPVSPADFMRFLFRWQHVETIVQADGARRAEGGRRRARRIRARGGRVGASGAAGAARSLRPVDARHDLPRGRSRMGASLAVLPP